MGFSTGSCSPLGTSQFWEPLGSASATPTLLLHYVLSLPYSLLLSSRSSFSCNNRVPRGVRCTSLLSTITATAYYHYEHFSAKPCSQIVIIKFKFYWSCRRCVSISVIFRSVSYNSIGYSSHAFLADISSSPVLNIVDNQGGVILSILFISRINIVSFNVSNLSHLTLIYLYCSEDNVVLDSAIQRSRRCNYTHLLQSFSVSSAWTRDLKSLFIHENQSSGLVGQIYSKRLFFSSLGMIHTVESYGDWEGAITSSSNSLATWHSRSFKEKQCKFTFIRRQETLLPRIDGNIIYRRNFAWGLIHDKRTPGSLYLRKRSSIVCNT